jgi:hypothetical protein
MTNGIFIRWNRATPGRAAHAIEHFPVFLGYLEAQKAAGNIATYHPVVLGAQGGDMAGFVLILGEPARLGALTQSPEWQDHIARAYINLHGLGVAPASVDEQVRPRIALLQKWL